jgi:acyl dehydratase
MSGLTGSYVRALARQLPLLGGRGDALPDRELVLAEVAIDRGHLAAYQRVCRFWPRDVLPPTYPHVVAFPLARRLITARDFPLRPLSLVHIANRIDQHRLVRVVERLSLRVRAERLRADENGMRFDIVADVAVDGETVWRQRSGYLHREGGRARPAPDPPPREAGAVWRVPVATGRRYAAVSGDRNPIHLHPLAARALGRPGRVAHPMWLMARCAAALEEMLPSACAIEVSFRAPLSLPSTAGFASWPADGARAFAVHGGHDRRLHLTGRVAPL